jgi:AraC-like DNA-binding protein
MQQSYFSIPRESHFVLSEILSYMRRHFSERLVLDDLCRLSQRSRYQIIRAFRRELGLTPHAYLVALRTHRAAAMLADGVAAADVAAEAGFADQSHLARHLKRHYVETPASLQRRYQPAD